MAVEVLDTTIRDGSYAVGFQIPTEDACILAATLDAAGVPYIEIGHGWGVDVHAQLPYESLPRDQALPPYDEREYFAVVRASVRRARVGAPLFASCPGVDVASLGILTDARCDFVRILIHPEEAATEKVARLVERAKLSRLLVSINFLKTYAFPERVIEEAARRVEGLGADWAYVVDSAGGMRPDAVRRYVERIAGATRLRVGFHGHNNLGMGVANALAAVDGGATLLDGSLQGLGRATGNPSTEHLVAWLQLDRSLALDIDRATVFAAGRAIVRPMIEGGFEAVHVLSGVAQLHSDWLPRIERIASRHGVGVEEVVPALGRAASDAGGLARVSDETVAAVAARLPPPSLVAPAASPTLARLEDASGATEILLRLLRIAALRDRRRAAVALVPWERWHTVSPHVTIHESWAVGWIPMKAGESPGPIPDFIERIAVARELRAPSSSDPRFRTFSLDDAEATAVDAVLDGAAGVAFALEDPERERSLTARVAARPASAASPSWLVAAGARGRDAAARSHGQHVLVLGRLDGWTETISALEERGVRVAIPDIAPAVLAATAPAVRELASRPVDGGNGLWIDPKAELAVELAPVAHAARLGEVPASESATERLVSALLELRLSRVRASRPRVG